MANNSSNEQETMKTPQNVQGLACDLFEYQSKDYLIAVDGYSHFFEGGRLQQPEVLS